MTGHKMNFGSSNMDKAGKTAIDSPSLAGITPVVDAAQKRRERIQKLEARLQREKARDTHYCPITTRIMSTG